MARRESLSPRRGGRLADMGSALAGSVVFGLVLAFTGPFLTILGIVASFIYGPVVMFRMVASKLDKEHVPRDWG